MAKIAELERQLGNMEAQKARAEGALRRAEREFERLKASLDEAERDRATAAALAESGGWPERRKARAAEHLAAELRPKVDEAARAVEAARGRVEAIADLVAGTQAELAAQRGPVFRRRAAGLTAAFAEKQAELLSAARELAALYLAAERATPRRLVSQRVPGRFVRCHCPAMASLHRDTVDNEGNARPGIVSVEYFKAIEGARKGKWTIVPGEDLAPPLPSEVEREWTSGPLPEEVARIRDVNVGRALSADGDGRGELTFNAIAAQVTEDEIAAALRAVAEG